MGRSWRASAGGYVYHVLNRANARLPLFQKDGDYVAFESVLAEARARYEVPILGYCLMPNHWHLVLWPTADGDLSRFVGWLTLTHTQRWHAHYHSVGAGHLYHPFLPFLSMNENSGNRLPVGLIWLLVYQWFLVLVSLYFVVTYGVLFFTYREYGF